MRFSKHFRTALLCAALMSSAASAFAAPDTPLQHGHEYLVTASYPNDLTVLDAQSDSIYKTCKLPGAFGPGTLVMSPDHSRAYILENHYADLDGIDLDSCKPVFHASLALHPDERARAMFSIAISPDGRELYSIANPTKIKRDTYVVEAPRLQVYATNGGMDAKPIRMFPAPRQTTLMATADDGSLYVVGADIDRIDPKTGKLTVAQALRHWTLPHLGEPDVLDAWPQLLPQHALNLLFTGERYAGDKKEPGTGEMVYGVINLDLKTGKIDAEPFGPITELYFTGARSPKDPNLVFGVLKRLSKYDSKAQKKIATTALKHSYYALAFNTAGTKLYLAGALDTIAVYDPDTLQERKEIKLRDGGDMAIATPQVFVR